MTMGILDGVDDVTVVDDLYSPEVVYASYESWIEQTPNPDWESEPGRGRRDWVRGDPAPRALHAGRQPGGPGGRSLSAPAAGGARAPGPRLGPGAGRLVGSRYTLNEEGQVMIEVKEGQVVVSCASHRCVRAEGTEFEGDLSRLTEKGQLHIALTRFEVRGWFFEQFPKRTIRPFCPVHAPAYRTMFHRAMGYTSAVLFFLLLGSCGNVEEVTQPDSGVLVKGRVESDAGRLMIDLGTGGSGAGGAGAGGSIGNVDSGVMAPEVASSVGGSTGQKDAGVDLFIDADPPPLCPDKVVLQPCTTTPHKTAVCLRDDGSQDVDCTSDPVYKFLCVPHC